VLVRLVLWSLVDSRTTIAELRRYLRDESPEASGGLEGLRLQLWVSDEATERWGELSLWESREASEQALPARLRELIGKDPDLVDEFDLEASLKGRYAEERLSRLGLAFEP
jgi:hypothetical protein